MHCVETRKQAGATKEQIQIEKESFIAEKEENRFEFLENREVPPIGPDGTAYIIGFSLVVLVCLTGCIYWLCKRSNAANKPPQNDEEREKRPSDEGLKEKSDTFDDIEMSCSEDVHAKVDEHVFKVQ